ncbi:MAG: glycosyltransferase family 9 protein [Planctomycetota bacterium]
MSGDRGPWAEAPVLSGDRRSRAEPNRIDGFAEVCGVRLEHPVPVYHVPDADREWARAWLAERGIELGRGPVVCLHLKSARAEKDWPFDKMRELARRLIDRDVRVVGLERIQQLDTPGIVGATGLSLPRAAALIAACDLLAGPDSGPMHLAASVGTPCVALFGPTDPDVILKHYAATHRAISADKGTAGRAPTSDIEVHEVLAAVEELIDSDDAPASSVCGPQPSAEELLLQGGPDSVGLAEGDKRRFLLRPLQGRPDEVRATQRPRGKPPAPDGVNPESAAGQSILFIADKVYPETLGGAEISMHLLLERLRALGHKTVACKWQRHARRRLDEVIERHDPGWIFTQLCAAPDVVREAKRRGRKVAVFVCSLAEHVCAYRENGLHICIQTNRRAEPLTCSLGCMRRRTDIEAQREMFRAADLVSCNSEYTRRVIERVFGRASSRRLEGREYFDAYASKNLRKRLLVQYPLVAQPRESGSIRRRYITMIRPSASKGQRMFEQLVRLMPGREFLVVGALEVDVPWERVAYLPAAPNMGGVYRATRILLQPAVNAEAFGRTVAEAAAYGIPSVVSSQGGLPEALGPGGIAVDDFQNAEAWVEAIEQVEQNYDAYADAALEHAKKFLSVEALLGALRSADESRAGAIGPIGPIRPMEDARGGAPLVTVMTDGFPGVRGSFRHLEAVVPFVKAEHFAADRAPPPGLCVLGGWRRDYAAYIRRHHRRSDVAFALSWHSSWNQIEQSGEWRCLTEAFELLRGGLITKLFASCEETAAVLSQMRDGVEWLPNTIDTSVAERAAQRAAGRDIDLFCSASPRKNIYPQLAALAGADATLHVNHSFSAAEHEAASMLRVRVVRHSLPKREEYYDVIARMAAGLQVSLAESFNYVAAEHMLLGVPVVTSRHVPCKAPGNELVVDDEHSPAAVRAKLVPLLDDAALRGELAQRCREHILRLADKHNRLAADVLSRAAA